MEIWILTAAGSLVTMILAMVLWELSKLRNEYIATFSVTLRNLVTEWNKLAQTVNALVMTYPEGENDDTGHLTASEGDASHVMAMSPRKRELYAARKGRRS